MEGAGRRLGPLRQPRWVGDRQNAEAEIRGEAWTTVVVGLGRAHLPAQVSAQCAHGPMPREDGERVRQADGGEHKQRGLGDLRPAAAPAPEAGSCGTQPGRVEYTHEWEKAPQQRQLAGTATQRRPARAA